MVIFHTDDISNAATYFRVYGVLQTFHRAFVSFRCTIALCEEHAQRHLREPEAKSQRKGAASSCRESESTKKHTHTHTTLPFQRIFYETTHERGSFDRHVPIFWDSTFSTVTPLVAPTATLFPCPPPPPLLPCTHDCGRQDFWYATPPPIPLLSPSCVRGKRTKSNQTKTAI